VKGCTREKWLETRVSQRKSF